MNLSFLKQDIVKICKELNELGEVSFKHSIQYDGVYIPKVFFNNATYQSTLEKLMKNEELSKLLSNAMIVGTFNKLIKNQLSNSSIPLTEIVKEFDKLVENIIIYKVYVPLKGIELFSDNVNISEKVKIIKLDSQNINEYLPYVGQDDDINLLLPTALEVEISTADFEKAMEQSIDIGKYVVNFLRLVDYNGWDEENLSVRLPGYGSIKEGLRVFTVDSEKRNGTLSMQTKNDDTEFLELDETTLEDMGRLGSNMFGKLIDKYLEFQLLDLEQSILRSIIWFGESKVEVDNVARFIKLMLSIECLFNTNNSDPITATLRDRMAFTLANTKEERMVIAKKMNDLYNLRSKIVHHGNSRIKLLDLLNLENLAADAIVQFLTNEKLLEIKTKKELQQYFEELKYT
ncbi:hypothetical protein SAMN05421670_3014 [Psychrobacillus psychrotolerans]|uniref:Uncharacterized protein n=1 Tax=Psychrobacillus psychrotolerans TaxID=126156 RepID=A0A1I6A056_9BACI|nr:HEPN domain-containing protein [Psychrobacillus psychrotolerans]SFQ61993.1 hypothetical protein SAMN05421670_3014 [Psychrobacillus psychrotolerans]